MPAGLFSSNIECCLSLLSCDGGLWFAPVEWRKCRLGIQVLPLLPVTEVLFRDVGFVKDLVNWALPTLAREGITEGWKGFVYALEGVYDKESALQKVRALNGFDDVNLLSNSYLMCFCTI